MREFGPGQRGIAPPGGMLVNKLAPSGFPLQNHFLPAAPYLTMGLVRQELADAALVLLGHGTTLNENSAAVIYQHAAALRDREIFGEVREAFWKQRPHIKEVMSSLVARRVFIVPMFISEGYFSEEVIPRDLGFAEAELRDGSRVFHRGAQTFLYCKPVGTHGRITTVVLKRISEVMAESSAPPPAEITLILAGHGTERNTNSRKSLERQVELLRAKNFCHDVHAVFLEEEPRIATCYDLAQTKNLVVVPLFMSEGLHTQEDIPLLLGEREEVVKQRLERGDAAWKNPTSHHGKLVWYSASIGTAPEIADVILDRVRETAQD